MPQSLDLLLDPLTKEERSILNALRKRSRGRRIPLLKLVDAAVILNELATCAHLQSPSSLERRDALQAALDEIGVCAGGGGSGHGLVDELVALVDRRFRRACRLIVIHSGSTVARSMDDHAHEAGLPTAHWWHFPYATVTRLPASPWRQCA